MVVLLIELHSSVGCITELLHYQGGSITKVATILRWMYYRGGCITDYNTQLAVFLR